MAEQRHFEVYLEFANQLTDDLEQRVNIFISIENQTIMQAESMFRFHSGIPL